MEVLRHKLLAHVQAKVLRREWCGTEGWFSAVEVGPGRQNWRRVGLVLFLLLLVGIWPRRKLDYFVEIVKER